MTSDVLAPPNAEQRAAIRRINAFRQRFGDGHFYLACHAALPLALTPDLLYCLWVNFQQDSHQELIDIPWIAVSDLILSNLCEEVGYELYEMDVSVRNELLKQLQHDSRFGLKRIRELADFVMAYVEQELDHPDLDTKDLAQIQKLTALAYKQPNEAAHEIVLILTQLKLKDKTEWIRIAALVNSLTEPLSAFQQLLGYIRAMADLARGNLEAATAQMTKAVDANNQVRVEGVTLPVPEVINGMLPKSNEQDAPPLLSLDRLRFPLAIAGGTVISLLVLVGVQYGLRSLNPQQTPSLISSATPSLPTRLPSSPRALSSPQVSPSASPGGKQTPSPKPSYPSPLPSISLLPQPRLTSNKKPQPIPSSTASSPTLSPISATTASPSPQSRQTLSPSSPSSVVETREARTAAVDPPISTARLSQPASLPPSLPLLPSAQKEAFAISQQQETLDAHNQCRARVGVSPLRWSPQIAAKAQEWADYLSKTGNFEHSSAGSGYGENLAAGSMTPTALVNLWCDEQSKYNSQTGQCVNGGIECYHFTQVVWSRTTELGCGLASHPKWGKVLVCEYNPPGNYKGQRPY